MSTSNGVISKPVSIADVQQTIGSASNDLGTLCRHKNINIWSKKKPLNYGGPFYSVTVSDWYKGINNDYGLTIPYYNSYDNLKNAYDGNLNGWVYSAPTIYRLTDFLGYYQNAAKPIGTFSLSKNELNTTSENTAVMTANFNNISDTQISLSELKIDEIGKNLSNMYFGVMIFKSSVMSGYSGYITNNSTLSTLDVPRVELTIPAFTTEGTYTAYPCLCENMQTTYGTSISNNFIPIPYLSAQPFTISKYSGKYIRATGQIYDNYKKIHYLITLGGNGITFNPIYVYIELHDSNDNLLSSFAQINLGSRTLSTDAIDIEGDIDNDRISQQDMYTLYNNNAVIRATAGSGVATLIDSSSLIKRPS